MFILLPFLCFFSIFLIFQKTLNDLRKSFIFTSVIYGALVLTAVEGLNLFHAINLTFISCYWLIFTIIALFILFKTKHASFNDKKNFAYNFDTSDKFIIVLILFILIITLIIALIAAPNNFDSMTYHLSRVMHWIQNNSVEHYPTSCCRQLFSAPFAEYMILNFQVLSKNDYYSNLIQWFSMLGSVIGVSLIAKQLGAGIKGQLFSSAIAVCIPMGILQSTSTQNDYVTAFWIICFIYSSLCFLKSDKKKSRLFYSVLSGVSLGLAFLTKATSYLFTFPFLVWFTIRGYNRYKFNILKYLFIISTLVLLVNGNFYYRNYQLFNSPLAPQFIIETQKNASVSVKSISLNIIKNLCLHLQTPSLTLNKHTENFVENIHKALKIGINDKRFSFLGLKFELSRKITHEDLSGNFLHLNFIFISLILFFRKTKNINTEQLYYLVCIICGFIIFCGYLKWQPWGTRLQLPLFLLFSPFIGTIFSEHQNKKLFNSMIFFILIASAPWLFLNFSRMLTGKYNILNTPRIFQYFNNCPHLRVQYLNVYKYISSQKNFSNIGLIIGGDDYEYPLWVLLNNRNQYKIRHIDYSFNRNNDSMRLYKDMPYKDFTPCVIISTRQFQDDCIYYKGRLYKKTLSEKDISIFTTE